MKSAVQIVKFETDPSRGRSCFILNKPLLESVLNIHKDRKIVVVSAAGAYRQGKSFLLNIFLRYLRLASTGSTPENGWLKRGGPLQGFESDNGPGGCTKGIWAYPDLFVFTLNDSSEVAVMLVDCQGAFDNHANPEECSMVFTFSVLMSSVQRPADVENKVKELENCGQYTRRLQIYNVNGRIQRDNLENLQLFVAYGKLSAEDQGKENDFKPFQKLVFNVRDFANPEEFAYGQEGGKEYLLKELSSHGQSYQLKNVKEFVWDTFEDVECYLMPYPGQSVALGRSDYMSKMEDEFAEHAERLTESIFHPDGLVPKRVAGKEITGSNLIDLIESYAKILENENCIDANTILQIKANFSNNELQKELFTEYTNLMTESLESNPWAHAQSKHEAIKAAVFNKFDIAKKLGGDIMAAKHRDELEKNIEAAYNSFVNQNNSRTEKIQAKKAAENNEKKRREAERTVEQAKMEKGYSEAVLKEERDRMRQEERRRKDDLKEQTEMLEKMAKQYDERVNRHLAAQEARAEQIQKEQREMQKAAERHHQEQMHAMRDSYRELSDVKGMAKWSHNLSNIVSAMISGSSKSETAQDSSIKCVICEAPKEDVKIGNHYGCNNSCITCRKFFESSVKNMTKSSHKFLAGKNATRHCYNNFRCEVKGKRPCTSCRFLKCIENQMNPELPLKSAAIEVQRNDPEGQNRRLDDYTKALRPIYESNLDILVSAAHEARANSKIEPALISGSANNCEESSETVYSDVTDPSRFSKQCVICEDQGENVKFRNHYGCENCCDACRKFFEDSVKKMTKSNHKFLAGKNVTRHCYNNFGCEVKGKRACISCRFLKCIENQMNAETPLKNAAREVQRNDPQGQNRRLDDYTKELRATYESNLDILLSAAQEARANDTLEEYSKPLLTPFLNEASQINMVANEIYVPVESANFGSPSTQIHAGANEMLAPVKNVTKSDPESDEDSENEEESSAEDPESEENNEETLKKSNVSNQDGWFSLDMKKFILERICDTYAEFCPGSCSTRDKIKLKKKKFKKLTLDAMSEFPAQMSSKEYYNLDDTTKDHKKQKQEILKTNIKKIETNFKHLKRIANKHSSHVEKRQFQRQSRIEKIFLDDPKFKKLINDLYLCMNPQKRKDDGLPQNNSALISQQHNKIETAGTSAACHASTNSSIDPLKVLSPGYEFDASTAPSTSGINTNPPNLNFVKDLIIKLTDELYYLARKKIGGTVIINHLCEDTAVCHANKETFISHPKAIAQLYQPGLFKKIFTSEGVEHDGAVIFHLSDGLVESVSVKLYTMKHECRNKCANRGTRHSSACSFSNFTTVPIIVISEEKGQVSLFRKGGAQFGIGKEDLKKELLKAYVTQEALFPVHGFGAPSTSGINMQLSNNTIFVLNLIVQLVDETYAISCKKIGGTVIINHLEKTTDFTSTKATFITAFQPYNQPYQTGVLQEIFMCNAPQHDATVIVNLSNGLIDSIGAKLSMMKHDCKNECASRGTRHSSACSVSNFTTVPIIVISEERGQVSLFRKGGAQFGIDKEDLKMELLNAYVTQEVLYPVHGFGAPSTSGINMHFPNNTIFGPNIIEIFVDEIYALSCKKIGGTVIAYHLQQKTTDWTLAKEIFIMSSNPYNQPYQPFFFEKIFKSKGPEHDGAVIFHLSDGLIESVAVKLSMMKHNFKCECASRGTRHSSACSFSHFTTVPIIVISQEGQVSLFRKGDAQYGIDKDGLKKELLEACVTQEVLSPVHEFGAPSTSGINMQLSNNTIFMQHPIFQLVDETYVLSWNKIGGTVIAYHLFEETANWILTKEMFIDKTQSIPYNQPYQPGVLEKIFALENPLHDGAVIFHLSNGLIDSVSAKLSVMKHDCKIECANRGTRHSSACSFSNFTTVPIIVVSEEKGQVSLFWKGDNQYGIDKDDLKKKLLKAYVAQEATDPSRFSKQCVICEEQGENAKIRNHYGCESSCDACRHFFGESVKNMTKSSHKFLGGKNADRHCYNNFGCEVKGKRPCASCRFLKCIDNQMNPELPLKSAAMEVQKNDPEGQNRPLDDYTKELRPIFESNLDILLSAANEARANSKIEPALISGLANNCEESSEMVYSYASDASHFSQLTLSEAPPQGTYDNTPGNHSANVSYPQQPNSFHDGYMPNVQETHNWNNQNNGNEYTDLAVPYDSSQVSVANNPQQPAYYHYGYWPNVVSSDHLHNPVGNSSYGSLVQVSGYQTSVPVVQNYSYYLGQSVNHAGPSTQILEQCIQNSQLDPAVPKDIEIKDTTREGSNKRKNPTENVNKKAKRSISADPFNRLAIKHNTDELCKILNTFGMKMDTGFKCDYGNNPPDKRCECGRSLALPDFDQVSNKRILRNTMLDGPHHFANWMCHNSLHPDIFALENPMKELFRKSICPAGRFYQSRDLKEYFEAESKKNNGKYVELKKSELRSDVNYFICCKRKDQFYWQIYYGTDELCVAGYGLYPDYDEHRYFFNKEFHQ